MSITKSLQSSICLLNFLKYILQSLYNVVEKFLKIPMRQSDTVICKCTDNTTVKTKVAKRQT